jgi:hypothetical protein
MVSRVKASKFWWIIIADSAKPAYLGPVACGQTLRGAWNFLTFPMGSMYAIYGNIYHQYTPNVPNVSIYTIHGSYGFGIQCHFPISETLMSTKTPRLHRQNDDFSRRGRNRAATVELTIKATEMGV